MDGVGEGRARAASLMSPSGPWDRKDARASFRTRAEALLARSEALSPDVRALLRELAANPEPHAATQALLDETELLGVTLRCIGDAVIATDTRRHVTLMNRVAEELTGVRAEEAVGQPLSAVFRTVTGGSGEHRLAWDAILERGAGSATSTLTLVTKSGGTRRVAHRATPMRDRDDRTIGSVIVFRDVTEDERREGEVQRMAKLDSLGTMAGGIAHDFNNLLTAIIGNLGLGRSAVAAHAEAEALRHFDDAEKAVLRARDLARQLVTFSAGGAPLREPVALLPLVHDAVAFALSGSRSRCDVECPDELLPVSADAGQVSQVLHNLLLNADQAMPDGGTVLLTLENVPADAAPRPLPFVRIVIRDQGAGIPDEIRERIFDPFFTTKPRGSGLGLASVHSIVRGHDGTITFESAPGKGTAFTVLLPASPTTPLAAPVARSMGEPLRRWRVLVLDDEPLIISMAERVLAKLGQDVVTVVDGTEAIEAWRRARDGGRPFDLAILDLTIPGGLGGREVIERLRVFDKAARAVATSGYSADPIMARSRAYGFAAHLAKPYSMGDLRELLERLQGEDLGR